MAIDTTQKKLSVLNAGNPWIGPLFDPDATIDLGDKQHVLNLYSGITVSSFEAVVETRFSIEGTSTARLSVPGTSTTRFDLTGTNAARLSVPGTSTTRFDLTGTNAARLDLD